MRILLISPNRSRPPVMPIGMRYIAEACLRDGHQVSCLDHCFESPTEIGEVIRRQIVDYCPDVIGISLRNLDVEDPEKLARYNYANYNLATYNLANYSLATYSMPEGDSQSNLESFDQAFTACRNNSNALVVLGGAAFTLLPKQFLRRYQGAVGIVGPGERAFLNLLKELENGREFNGISGVVTSESLGEDFARISTESLPSVPSTEETRLPSYLVHGGEYNIQTKRGCEFKCIHCSYPMIEGNEVRTHDPEEVGTLIASLVEKGITRFRFVDSVFNNPVDHAIAVCDEIRKTVSFPIEFTVNCSPARFTRELASALKSAGCSKVIFGTDTASTAMLRVMRKPFSKEQIRFVTSVCQDLDLYFEHHMLLGAPGETMETALESLTFMGALECPVFVDLGIQVYNGAPIAKLLGFPQMQNDEFVPPIFIEPTISEQLPDLIVSFCSDRSNMHTFIVRDSGPIGFEAVESSALQTQITAEGESAVS